MKLYLICPSCGSDDVMKNGMTRRGKQNHKCRDCDRQFVENPHWKPKASDTLSKIKLLLLERISLAGIARVMGVSKSWLQDYVNQLYGGYLWGTTSLGHYLLSYSGGKRKSRGMSRFCY